MNYIISKQPVSRKISILSNGKTFEINLFACIIFIFLNTFLGVEFADLFPAPRVLAMISSRRRLRASRSSSSFFNFSSNSACLRSASSWALRSASLRLASSSS